MQPQPLEAPEADLTFPHTYEVEKRFELPGLGMSEIPTFYIPPPDKRLEHDGVWLTIKASNGVAWTGVFAYGYSGPPGISRIMSSPDPDSVIVISRGAAYLVRADDPHSWQELPVMPVTDAIIVPEHQLVLFADFGSLYALGPEGLKWAASRICVDDLKILRVVDSTIFASGYEPSMAETINFSVDLNTGIDTML